MHGCPVEAFPANLNPNELVCHANQINCFYREEHWLEMRYGPVILTKNI